MFRRFSAAPLKKRSGIFSYFCRGDFQAPRHFYFSVPWDLNELVCPALSPCFATRHRQNLPIRSHVQRMFLPSDSKNWIFRALLRSLSPINMVIQRCNDQLLLWCCCGGPVALRTAGLYPRAVDAKTLEIPQITNLGRFGKNRDIKLLSNFTMG